MTATTAPSRNAKPDLLVAWCTDSDAVTSAISANIAVTIDADVLALTRPKASEASQAAWCELQRAPGVSGEVRAAAA